mmetsp:Transcript_20659/g.36869  ORF Transcript_20659/g.36869 Transcript_20659/m.36869 type:complete len:294 (-) Transcript_20659:1201-2082(-)
MVGGTGRREGRGMNRSQGFSAGVVLFDRPSFLLTQPKTPRDSLSFLYSMYFCMASFSTFTVSRPYCSCRAVVSASACSCCRISSSCAFSSQASCSSRSSASARSASSFSLSPAPRWYSMAFSACASRWPRAKTSSSLRICCSCSCCEANCRRRRASCISSWWIRRSSANSCSSWASSRSRVSSRRLVVWFAMCLATSSSFSRLRVDCPACRLRSSSSRALMLSISVLYCCRASSGDIWIVTGLGVPRICCAMAAKCSVDRVSRYSQGLMVQMRTVSLLPPTESESMRVSLESR